jgi:hypothetical protein
VSAAASDLPARSPNGMAALDIFYSDFNDVSFYVEDEGQENLYEEILKKLFSRLRVAPIFPLGGKAAVLQHATSTSNDGIRCFRAYLVDRDFDHLLGKRLEHPNVFYLDRFCIESHLLEASAVVEVVIENHPKRRRADIAAALSLDVQLSSIYGCLRPLFMLFFCAQCLDLGVKNCSLPPEAFCKPRRLWELNDASIVRYERELKTAAQAKLLDPPIVDPQSDVRLSRAARASDYALVSGKFVAAMLFHYVKSKYSLGSMTFESFVYRVAKNSALLSMRPLATRVRASVRAHAANSAIASRKQSDA